MNNQLCWFKNNNNLWDKGHIIDKLTVSINNTIIKTNTDKLLLRNKDEEDKQSDLLQILHLNEPTILNSVNLRYRDNKIYTFAGEILIAVNPYKIVNLYSKEIMANYNIQNCTSPHPYYVANNSLINIKRSSKNQSILIRLRLYPTSPPHVVKVAAHVRNVAEVLDDVAHVVEVVARVVGVAKVVAHVGEVLDDIAHVVEVVARHQLLLVPLDRRRVGEDAPLHLRWTRRGRRER